jgi:hypothetical protein
MTTKKKVVKKTVRNQSIKKTAGRVKKKVPTIFVQIAAYRDPELLHTLRSLLQNADHPENLTIAIGWQHSPYEKWDNLDEFKDDTRFKIIDIDYRKSKGVCWMREKIQKLYNGETYTLQLDSHHRFTEHWDTQVIEMLEGLRSKGHTKPLLSSYLPDFNPVTGPEGELPAPWIMEFDRFGPEGPVHFLPHTIDDWRELTSPVPSRFMSGHFIFADGIFVKEVPYDPNYYFHGEEIDLSVRSYMAGYDLFAPHRTIAWHEYYREGKSKHWEDHTNWASEDRISHAYHRKMYGIESKNRKLKDNVRTLQEYEMYAGLEFSTKRAHTMTIQKIRPPVSLDVESHTQGLVPYHKVCIDVYKGSLPEKDYNFWVVAFTNKDGIEFHRHDADENEINMAMSVPYEADKFVHIWRAFYSDQPADGWIVWPHSKSNGWCERLTGKFGR